jgi:hypothetical protein
MSVCLMSNGQMSIGKMSVSKMSVGKMPVGQMSVGQMSVGQMMWSLSIIVNWKTWMIIIIRVIERNQSINR